MTHTVIGSPKHLRREDGRFLHDCALDGLMLIFADYEEGLRVAGREILPRLRRLGMSAQGLDRAVTHRAAAGRLQVDFASPDGADGAAGL